MCNNKSSRIPISQLPCHCGPTSLSSCLYLLGISASPRDLVSAAGKPIRVFYEGLDEYDLMRAAGQFGAAGEFLCVTVRRKGSAFVSQLKNHLESDFPALIVVWDFSHWVAVVGINDGKFVIMDPSDDTRCFNLWSPRYLLKQAWNCDGEEQDQYFAFLLKRKDGAPASWKFTKSFMRICEVGSEMTAAEFAKDLREMTARATKGCTEEIPGKYLADILLENEKTVLNSIDHWIAPSARETNTHEVKNLYKDYTTIAGATGLRFPSQASTTELMMQITIILTTYAILGELE